MSVDNTISCSRSNFATEASNDSYRTSKFGRLLLSSTTSAANAANFRIERNIISRDIRARVSSILLTSSRFLGAIVKEKEKKNNNKFEIIAESEQQQK